MRASELRRLSVATAIGLTALSLAAFWGATSALIGGVLPLLLVVSFGAAALVLFDFRLGVMALIVVFPISHTTLFPHELFGVTGLNPLNLLLVATLGSYLVFRFTTSEIKSTPYSKTLLLCYVLPITLAGLYGATQVANIPEVLRMGTMGVGNPSLQSSGAFVRDLVIKPMFLVLFAHLIACAMYQSKSLTRFWVALLIGLQLVAMLPLLLVVISGLGLDILGASYARGFLSILGLHANELGFFFGFGYAIVLFSLPYVTTLPGRLATLVVLGTTAIAVMVTFSRGGYLFFLIITIAFVIQRRKIKTILAGLVFGAASLALLPQAVVDRVMTGTDAGTALTSRYQRDELTAGRVQGIWLPLLPEVASHALLGNGRGAIMWSNAMREGAILPVALPHNLFLRILLDIGLVGFAAMCVVFVWLRRQFKHWANDCSTDLKWRGVFQGASVALLALLVSGMANGDYAPAPENTFFWVAVGAALGLRQRTLDVQLAPSERAEHVRH
jgi:O-antigen ligase